MNNTVPLFSVDVSNVRKSNKRTVKGAVKETSQIQTQMFTICSSTVV